MFITLVDSATHGLGLCDVSLARQCSYEICATLQLQQRATACAAPTRDGAAAVRRDSNAILASPRSPPDSGGRC